MPNITTEQMIEYLIWLRWAVVVAPIPEVRGSNPVISKILMEHLFTVDCIEMTKIKNKKREAGIDPFFIMFFVTLWVF